MSKSYLLINEPPLTVSPTLAKIIGLDEAIVIQQVHYWLMNARNAGRVEEGEKWVYNSYEEWQEGNFPFWTTDKIQRLFLKLEKQGLIISSQFDAKSRDMTKFYRLAYDEICALHDSFLRPSIDANLHDVKMNQRIPENTSDEEKPPSIPLRVKRVNTHFQSGEQEQPDKVAEWLKMSQSPAVKRDIAIDDLLSKWAVAFVVKTTSKDWRKFAEYAVDQQRKDGWDPDKFIEWVKQQNGYPTYWTQKRMEENYPKAFIQDVPAQDKPKMTIGI